MENLNDVEFGSDKDKEEAPILVAQRYLNIFRQIHIFGKAKRDQFDDELLALPPQIAEFFKRLPGGRLLVEHLEEVKTERGIAFVKANKEDFAEGSGQGSSPVPSAGGAVGVPMVGGSITVDASFAESLAKSMAEAFKQNPMQATVSGGAIAGGKVDLGGAFDVIAEEIKFSRASLLDVLKETRSITDSVIASQVSISRILEGILSQRTREDIGVADLNNRIIASQASITKLLEGLYMAKDTKSGEGFDYQLLERKLQVLKDEMRSEMEQSIKKMQESLLQGLNTSNNGLLSENINRSIQNNMNNNSYKDEENSDNNNGDFQRKKKKKKDRFFGSDDSEYNEKNNEQNTEGQKKTFFGAGAKIRENIQSAGDFVKLHTQGNTKFKENNPNITSKTFFTPKSNLEQDRSSNPKFRTDEHNANNLKENHLEKEPSNSSLSFNRESENVKSVNETQKMSVVSTPVIGKNIIDDVSRQSDNIESVNIDGEIGENINKEEFSLDNLDILDNLSKFGNTDIDLNNSIDTLPKDDDVINISQESNSNIMNENIKDDFELDIFGSKQEEKNNNVFSEISIDDENNNTIDNEQETDDGLAYELPKQEEDFRVDNDETESKTSFVDDGLTFELPEQSSNENDDEEDVIYKTPQDFVDDGLSFALPSSEDEKEDTSMEGNDYAASMSDDDLNFELPQEAVLQQNDVTDDLANREFSNNEEEDFGDIESIAENNVTFDNNNLDSSIEMNNIEEDSIDDFLSEQSDTTIEEDTASGIDDFLSEQSDTTIEEDSIDDFFSEQSDTTVEEDNVSGIDDFLSEQSDTTVEENTASEIDDFLSEQSDTTVEENTASEIDDFLDNMEETENINNQIIESNIEEEISPISNTEVAKEQAVDTNKSTQNQSLYSAELEKIRQALTADEVDISSLDKPIALDDYMDDENVPTDDEYEVSNTQNTEMTLTDEQQSENDEEWEWEYVDEEGNPVSGEEENNEEWEWEYVEEDDETTTDDNKQQ